MAFVRKRAGRWYVRFVDESGIQVEKATKASTKMEAARLADELERRAERVRLGLDTENVALSFKDLWEQFAPVARAMRSWTSIESRYRLHLEPEFGDRLIHTIRPGDVRAFLARKQTHATPIPNSKRRAKPLSIQSAEHLRVDLSSMFAFAIEELKVLKGENPARAIGKLKVPQRPPKYLTEDQVVALILHVPDQWRGLFAVALYTGLRASELKGLRVADVDLRHRVLTVWFTASGGTTKSSKHRFVPIPDELVPYLRVELGRARSTWLFSRKDGSALTKDLPLPEMTRRALVKAGHVQGYDHHCVSRGKAVGCGLIERRADAARFPCPKCSRFTVAKAVPLDIAFKDLRSTFGTHSAEQTGDLRIVQRALGHQDIETTEKRYAFARDRRFQSALAGLSFARPMPATESKSGLRAPNESKVVHISERATPGDNGENQRRANDAQ
jgi:integrase